MSDRDISIERVRRAEQSKDIKPLDLLRTIIADIEDGEFEADGLVVTMLKRGEGSEWNVMHYRCGITRPEEYTLYGLASAAVIERWKGE